VELIKADRYQFGSALRNIAVKHAKGEIVAFLEDHVLVQKNYLKNLVATFSKGYDIVGGHVANANPERFVGWTQYFCEYNKFIPLSRDGEVEDLPGCNFAYSSDLVEKLGPFYEGPYKLENLFHGWARKSGYRLYLTRDLQVAHINGEKIIGFWRKRFEYGRLFASQRGFSLKRRILYAVLSPLIAMIEYTRIFKRTKNNRTYLIKFIQSTPLLLPTLLIWMMGECFGYLFGVSAANNNLRGSGAEKSY
jgi:GT2 family glycosyltransferase